MQDSTLRNMLNTYDFVNPGFRKSHTSLDNIVSLENRITYEISLDNIVSLENRITYKIMYDFWRDRTTVQLCSCRQRIWASLGKAGITKITYDYTIV